jgi:hypothetical protein
MYPDIWDRPLVFSKLTPWLSVKSLNYNIANICNTNIKQTTTIPPDTPFFRALTEAEEISNICAITYILSAINHQEKRSTSRAILNELRAICSRSSGEIKNILAEQNELL